MSRVKQTHIVHPLWRLLPIIQDGAQTKLVRGSDSQKDVANPRRSNFKEDIAKASDDPAPADGGYYGWKFATIVRL